MTMLTEGLKAGDLEELVVPTISIDEYESKLDDDSIVVAFFAKDRDPSQDLNRYLQKGAVDVLDTDVSPAPNEDGFYVVFVEMLRDQEFPAKMISMLDSLEGLTAIENWTADIYDVEGQQPVDEDLLRRMVRLTSVEDANDVEESLTEFFRASDLEGMVVEGHDVRLEGRRGAVELQFVDLGNVEAVVENNALMGAATRLDESALSNCRRLHAMLGEGWLVEQRGDLIVVGRVHEDTCALLQIRG